MTTYRLTFRHPKGYRAHAKVRAESLAQAVAILKQRKPYATNIRAQTL